MVDRRKPAPSSCKCGVQPCDYPQGKQRKETGLAGKRGVSAHPGAMAPAGQTPGTPRHAGMRAQEKGPGDYPGPLDWWWDGARHRTTIESTQSKRCGLLRTGANSIEKPAGRPMGRGRSSRFFALISCRCAASTSSAFRGQFSSQTRNRTRVPQSSAQAVPDSPTTALLIKCAALDQRPEMLLQRVAAGPG